MCGGQSASTRACSSKRGGLAGILLGCRQFSHKAGLGLLGVCLGVEHHLSIIVDENVKNHGLTTDLTVLDVFLISNGPVYDHLKSFTAVRTMDGLTVHDTSSGDS